MTAAELERATPPVLLNRVLWINGELRRIERALGRDQERRIRDAMDRRATTQPPRKARKA